MVQLSSPPAHAVVSVGACEAHQSGADLGLPHEALRRWGEDLARTHRHLGTVQDEAARHLQPHGPVQGRAGGDGAGEVALRNLGQLRDHGGVVARRVGLDRTFQRRPDPRGLGPVAGVDPEAEGDAHDQAQGEGGEENLEKGHGPGS